MGADPHAEGGRMRSGEEARMDAMETRNGKIVDAIVRKERAECPGALALIGIYGSFLTGDVHPLSDLDLLILINDDRGRKLAAAFVEDDPGVGHDLYCTTWDDLREDARYEHPHISKLMDSRVVYCADERYRTELESLRDGVRRILEAPFSEADFERADGELDRARCCFARAAAAETLSEVRRQAGGMLYYAENALALLYKTYFRLGVRRRYEELEAMKRRPADVRGGIDAVLRAGSAPLVKEKAAAFLKELTDCFDAAAREVRPERKKACAETLSGTWEEMVSNWRGKMRLAAETHDRHLAFMSLESLNEMLRDVGGETAIGAYDALSAYDPEDLIKTAAAAEALLNGYLREYEKAGVKPERYPDVDAFLAAYLGSGADR